MQGGVLCLMRSGINDADAREDYDKVGRSDPSDVHVAKNPSLTR